MKKSAVSQKQQRRIYGIDFSGAKDAGTKIWMSGGAVEEGVLMIDDWIRAEQLTGAGHERGKCHAALREFMAKEKDCTFGLDFPFGLPLEMVRENSWEEFILLFPANYIDAGDFRKKCQKASPNHERKRVTDVKCKTPFSPYNLRVYRQTYYGICDLLNPLVRQKQVCVLPMQKPQDGKPWILEICPASTLKKMNLYRPYKGKGYRKQREYIIEAIEMTGSLSIREQTVREKIIGDSGGDALDSVIAAYSTYRALCAPFALTDSAYPAYMLEGYVYL